VQLPEATAWLHSTPFREQAHDEQKAEVERIAHHVEISLTELIQQAGEETDRAQEAIQRGEQGQLASAPRPIADPARAAPRRTSAPARADAAGRRARSA